MRAGRSFAVHARAVAEQTQVSPLMDDLDEHHVQLMTEDEPSLAHWTRWVGYNSLILPNDPLQR